MTFKFLLSLSPHSLRIIQDSRYAKQDGWEFGDISLCSSGNIAVSGHREGYQSYVCIYGSTVDNSFSRDKPTLLYHKQFTHKDDWRSWLPRCISFIKPNSTEIVTCRDDEVQVIDYNQDVVLRSRILNGRTRCLAVSESQIFVGLMSVIVNIYDNDLNRIKAIRLKGIRDVWPRDIAAAADKLYVSTMGYGYDRAIEYSQDSGRLLKQYTGTGQYSSKAWSITVNIEFGLIAILWNQRDTYQKQIVFYLLPGNKSFLTVNVESGISRIRISDKGRIVTGNKDTGEVKIYDLANLFSYGRLKESLVSRLGRDDCEKLADFFTMGGEKLKGILNSYRPASTLLLALEEKGVIQPSNVDRLEEAFLVLKMSPSYYAVNMYQKLRDTPFISTFEKFVAGFSTFLTSDLFEALCNYFNISSLEKSEVLSKNAPGLSLLALLKAKNIITPTDVSALAIPSVANLKQVMAKINRYQRDLRESKISSLEHRHELTLEEKADIFIYYLHLNTKSWYESICPLPWKKASHWGLSDLFIACGLTLTNTKSQTSLKNVDAKCMVKYDDIFTHSALQDASRIVVEGNPGSGKTILASQIANDCMEGKFENIKFAILLQLKYVEDMTIPDAITKLILPLESPLTEADVEAFLENTDPCKVCLMLDGLEEYTGGGKKFGPKQSEVMKVMNGEKLPATKVIVTTRSEYLQDLPECPMLKIRQFGKQERDNYVKKILPQSIEKQNDVIMAVENNPLLLELCDVPLLFVMAVHNIDSIAKVSDDETEKVTPFVRNIIQTLCTMGHKEAQLQDQLKELKSPDSHEEDTIDFDDSEIFFLTLEEIAFNGLCTGKQQLSWPMNFLQDKISNIWSWIDSGILIVEETRGTKKSVTTKTTMEVTMADEPSPSDKSREDLLTETDIETKGMRPEIKDDDAPIIVSDVGAPSGDKQHIPETNIDRDISKNAISVLQARFLHKIIQEWFAAKHLSNLLKNYNQDEVEQCFNLISPIELHYVLRFASGISCRVSPLILTYLNRYHRGLDNDKQGPVADCICQCFLEHSGDREELKEVVTDFCKTGITICEEDSRQLQKAKISLLNFASENKISVLKVKLVDVCQSLLTEGNKIRLYLNSGVYLPTLQEVHSLTITSWGPQLQELDCYLLVKYLYDWPSLHEADLHFPVQPPLLEGDVIHKIKEAHKKVTWTIGAITHYLDETGEWRLMNLKGQSVPFYPHTHQQQSLEDEPSLSGLPSHGMFKAAETGRTSEELGSGQRVEGYHSKRKGRRLTSHEATVQGEPLSLDKLQIKGAISQNGGTIQIPDSSVKLRIPANAFWTDHIKHPIKMRIIPRGTYDEPAKSFADNSSVMVELLPNNLSLRHPAELTLPHCLQLREVRKCRVSIYVSHHDEGYHPNWEEITNATHHELSGNDCKIWLDRFCWVKYEIDGKEVEAKKLIVYTAGHKCKVNTDRVIVDVGYYPELIGANELLQQKLRNLFIADRQSFLFRKEPKHPLKITLEETTPDDWKTIRSSSSPKSISYLNIASSNEQSRPFVFQRQTEVPSLPICIFCLSQGEESTELLIDMAELVIRSEADVHHQENIATQAEEKAVPSEQFLESPQDASLELPLTIPWETPDAAVRRKLPLPENQHERGRYTGNNLQALRQPHETSQNVFQTQGQISPYHKYQMIPRSEMPSLVSVNPFIQQNYYHHNFSISPYGAPSVESQSLYEFPDKVNRGEVTLGYSLIKELGRKLDPADPLGNNWKELADKLSFTMEDIGVFELAPSPTFAAVECAMKRGTLKSIEQLKTVLENIGRSDAASLLKLPTPKDRS